MSRGKLCDRCGKQQRADGTRYCGRCKTLLIKQMEREGYLQPIPVETRAARRVRKPEEPDTEKGRKL